MKNKQETLQRERALRQAKADGVRAFMFAISGQDALMDFNAKLWPAAIRTFIVFLNGRIVFHFPTGNDIEA